MAISLPEMEVPEMAVPAKEGEGESSSEEDGGPCSPSAAAVVEKMQAGQSLGSGAH